MGRISSDGRADALLEGLTGPQGEAVTHTDGPLLVLAGAGCGKTRVITRRAAYLAHTVAEAGRVLAITFTNKAANEMRERLVALGVGREMTVCTFHSLCSRLLRIYHDRAGLPGDFTIFDAADQRKVIKDAVEKADLSTHNWSPARMQAVISRAKNAMVTSVEFAAQSADWSQRTVARIYAAYEEVLAAQHGLDFDDLLLKLALLLRRDGELREQLEGRYTHILIDEYQDTNSAQYEIARLMTQVSHNLCATGDPDQSIYGWRGADIRNILDFEKDYPEAKVVRLEQNYRSTQRILAAADAVIRCNVARKDKTLWTQNPEGPRVCVASAYTAEDEARFVAERIAARHAGGGSFGDVAIFYRINALSRAIEEALLKAGIPYQVARGTEFYNRKEIKDVLAYARVLINPRDEVALTRIINTPPRGIGKTTIDRLLNHARVGGMELFEVLRHAEQVRFLRGAASAKVAALASLLDSLAPLIDATPRVGLERLLHRTGLQAELSRIAEHDSEPMDNVNELINAASAYEEAETTATLRDWLEYTSLLGDVDAVDEDSGRVTLMTLHAAKGLEFPVVFIIAVEDGMLPFRREADDGDYDEEEERRLCFVGMTRSKVELVLSHAEYRMTRGVAQRKPRSTFLYELPKAQIDWIQAPDQSSEGEPAHRPRGRIPPDFERWQVGTLVRHPSHSLGRIMWIRPNGAQPSLGVRFQSGLEKTYIVPFCELERVDFDEVE